MSRVQFNREEIIVDDDGRFVRVESWTQQGDVLEVLPDGRIRVEWDDPHGWGVTVCVFHPEEVSPVRTCDRCGTDLEPEDVSCICYAR